MGSPYKPLEFWPIFTEKFVRILKLDIEVTPAAVAACQKFGMNLKALSKKMEVILTLFFFIFKAVFEVFLSILTLFYAFCYCLSLL